MKIQTLTKISSALLISGFLALAGCSTFKVSYDWEYYSREACKAEYEGWTRSQLHSSFPNALPIAHTVVGVHPSLGVIGRETWRIDENFVLEADFAYRINIPGGNFTPMKNLVIGPASPGTSLPQSRPDDRVTAAKVVRSPLHAEVYPK